MINKKLKIGILTFQFAYENYGALLQAYSLYEKLKELGVSPEIIDFKSKNTHYKIWQGWGIKQGYFGKSLKSRIYYYPKYIKKNKQFANKAFKYSAPARNYDELKEIANKYDAIIVGSDQVWNYYIFNNNNAFRFFLDFSKSTKISYAACFSKPQQPETFLEHAKKCLDTFSSISVRNNMSYELASTLVDKPIEVVCDPVFLNNFDYIEPLEVYSKKYPNGYILAHVFNDNKEFQQIANKIKTQTGLPIITNTFYSNYADEVFTGKGVEEWLKLLKGAKFIISQSFHATCFALKFEKPFIAVQNSKHNNYRIQDLCNRYGCYERLICTYTELEKFKNIFEIDYITINAKLNKHIFESNIFLKKSLQLVLAN